jgi:hypothetical protein
MYKMMTGERGIRATAGAARDAGRCGFDCAGASQRVGKVLAVDMKGCMKRCMKRCRMQMCVLNLASEVS